MLRGSQSDRGQRNMKTPDLQDGLEHDLKIGLFYEAYSGAEEMAQGFMSLPQKK